MPSRKVKLGILLPTRGLLLRNQQPTGIERLIGLAERAEQGGLDGVWVGDSLVAKPRMEPLSVLSALAVRTSRVRLGTAVLLPALRHPVLLAQTLATVELISEGRLVIGAGVGGAFNEDQKREWEVAGVPSRGRGRRFEEIIEIVHGLGSGRPFTFNKDWCRPNQFHLFDVRWPRWRHQYYLISGFCSDHHRIQEPLFCPRCDDNPPIFNGNIPSITQM